MSDLTTPGASTGLPARAAEAADELDQRFHLATGLRRQINKVFPGHWSFMLGEIALYSFVVLLLSGTYLALYFDPSMVEVTYQGPFVPLRGIDDHAAHHLLQRPRDVPVRTSLGVMAITFFLVLLLLAATTSSPTSFICRSMHSSG